MRGLVVLLCVGCGCSYPSFEFARDSGEVIDSAEIDSAEIDSAEIDTAIDSAMDTALADSAAPDTTVVDIGSADTASPDTADTAPPTGCATATTLFCDDFDTTPSFDKWDGAPETLNGTMSLVTTSPFSAPNALRAELTSGLTSAESFARIGKQFTAPTAASLTRMDMRLFIESSSYGSGKAILAKVQHPGGRGVGFLVSSSGYSIEVFGDTYSMDALPAGSVPIGKWFRLRIDLTLRPTGGLYRVFVDESLIAERSSISTTNIDAATRQFTLGLYTNNPTTAAYRVRFDDVRFSFP